jgi:hypothetical protein
MASKNVTRTTGRGRLPDVVSQGMSPLSLLACHRRDLRHASHWRDCEALFVRCLHVRNKGERVGRNPKTNVEVPIKPRRAVTFSASHLLKAHVNRDK